MRTDFDHVSGLTLHKFEKNDNKIKQNKIVMFDYL